MHYKVNKSFFKFNGSLEEGPLFLANMAANILKGFYIFSARYKNDKVFTCGMCMTATVNPATRSFMKFDFHGYFGSQYRMGRKEKI